jgi:ribulose 1,5-bisphosphate carboxylase large subunit-like protein
MPNCVKTKHVFAVYCAVLAICRICGVDVIEVGGLPPYSAYRHVWRIDIRQSSSYFCTIAQEKTLPRIWPSCKPAFPGKGGVHPEMVDFVRLQSGQEIQTGGIL